MKLDHERLVATIAKLTARDFVSSIFYSKIPLNHDTGVTKCVVSTSDFKMKYDYREFPPFTNTDILTLEPSTWLPPSLGTYNNLESQSRCRTGPSPLTLCHDQ